MVSGFTLNWRRTLCRPQYITKSRLTSVEVTLKQQQRCRLPSNIRKALLHRKSRYQLPRSDQAPPSGGTFQAPFQRAFITSQSITPPRSTSWRGVLLSQETSHVSRFTFFNSCTGTAFGSSAVGRPDSCGSTFHLR